MDYSSFIINATFLDINKELSRLVQADGQDSIDTIALFLTNIADDPQGKHEIPRKACRALLQKGPDGIKALYSLFFTTDGFIYPSTIITSIWCASQNNLEPLSIGELSENSVLNRPLLPETISAAKEAFHDIIITSTKDSDLFYKLIGTLYQLTLITTNTSEIITSLVHSISDSSIRITKKKIDEFSELIDSNKREEEYQIFIKNNPVFINPLASKIIDKHKLGDDLITDFVVQTLENKYVLVEIEKPQDCIFNKKGDFSATFTHAYGQVLDFVSWIDSNIAYAQKKLPDICMPYGMLIIGRKNDLNAIQKNKLNYFNMNSPRIKVYTYDDILSNAIRLYHNILLHK